MKNLNVEKTILSLVLATTFLVDVAQAGPSLKKWIAPKLTKSLGGGQGVDTGSDLSGGADVGPGLGGGTTTSQPAVVLNAFEAPLGYNGVVANNRFFGVIQKDQVLSIKVDLAERGGALIENAAFQFMVYTKLKAVAADGIATLNLNQSSQDAIRAAILTGGGHNSQAYLRALELPVYFREYLDNRVTLTVSRSPGDMASTGGSQCIWAGSKVTFNVAKRVNSASVPYCTDVLKNADGTDNKVWYVNIKLNHCDYTETTYTRNYLRRGNGDLIPNTATYTVSPPAPGSESNCRVKIEAVRDEIYFNQGFF